VLVKKNFNMHYPQTVDISTVEISPAPNIFVSHTIGKNKLLNNKPEHYGQ